MADDIVKVKIDTDTKDSVKSVIKYTAAIGGAVIAVNKIVNTSKAMVNAYRVQEQAERCRIKRTLITRLTTHVD